MRPLSIVLLLSGPFPLGGCGDDGSPDPDAGPDVDASIGEDAGNDPQGCVEPDRSCPDDQPVPSAPCEGDLDCEYEDDNGFDTWIYECREGLWIADLEECNLDGCPVPPLGELCLEPFVGAIEGATVDLGPADAAQPFAAFEDGDEVPLIVGAQGGSMVTFRLRVTGAEAPDCVGATISATVDGEVGDPQAMRVALHCGMSLPVFAILPGDYCDPATIPVEIEVEIDGLGTGEATVQFTSEGECAG